MAVNWIRLTLLSLMAGTLSVTAAGLNTFFAFGLTNTPLGDAQISMEGGTMLVTRGSYEWPDLIEQNPAPASVTEIGPFSSGTFGVSIALGEADAGIWAYPYYNGYFNDGDFMVGEVFGEVDGQPDRRVCTMFARREGEGNHSVQTDFSMIGAQVQVFEIYSRGTLLLSVTNTGGGATIHTYGQSGPRANPFWRLRDGSIASVVELSETSFISLPGSDNGAYGERLVIRAVNPASEVSFVSRVDVTGGGLSHFLITEARLGVFNHPHTALGPTVLNAAGAKLEVANSEFGTPGSQCGVAIELERLSRFDANLSPLDLGSNGTVVASAVATVNRIEGEFLGYAGVRSSNGVLSAFASLSPAEPEMEIAVYHEGCLAGSALAASPLAAIGLSGNPKITGMGATARGSHNRAGIVITLDVATSITLPGGAVVEGNEIRFQAPSWLAIERLTTFSVVASELAAFTISGETTPQTISLDEYLVDLRPGASVKRFIDNQGNSFTRTVGTTNRGPDASALIRVSDTYSNVVRTDLFSLQAGDLFNHGGVTLSAVDTFSAAGLRVLPNEIRIGQSYVGRGNFLVADPGHGQFFPQTTVLTTRAAAFETLRIPAGTFNALRIESTEVSVVTFPNSVTQQFVVWRTSWLVAGLGVAQFSFATEESVVTASLVDYSVITSEPRDYTANVGASVVFDVAVNTPANVFNGSVEWRRDGAVVANGNDPSLILRQITGTDGGTYSVTVSNSAGVVTGAAGSLRVARFSDPACFWARRAGGMRVGYGEEIFGRRVLVDASGNVWVLGFFTGPAIFGPFTLNSAGGYDIFVTKLSPAGEYLSATRLGGAQQESISSGALDAAGNLYIAGTFNGTTTLGTNTFTSEGSGDVFIAKLDSSGNVLWAAGAAGGNYEFVADLGVDSAGNVYVTGTFFGTAIQFGNIVLQPNRLTGNDLFLAKLDTSGNFLWARSVASASATALAIAPGGDIYVAGGIIGRATFDATILTPPLNRSAGFLTRVNADGNFLWAKQIGDGQTIYDMDVDGLGNVLVAGSFNGLADFGNAVLSSESASRWYPALFVAKIDPSGDFVWARKAAGTPYYDLARLAVDQQGNSYLYARFYSFADVGTAKLIAGPTLLMSKLDALGRTDWVKQFGSGDPHAVAADNNGNVYAVGAFGESALFGDFLLESPIPHSTSYNNIFVAKICSPPPPGIIAQPQSLTVNAGATASFNVSITNAPGVPVSYQWRKDGANVPGATSESLSIANAQAADAGNYSVLVTSEGGSVSSLPATLTVISPFGGSLTFGSATYSVIESHGVALIEVTRSGSLTGLVTVDFVTANGTAEANVDYVASAGTLRFGPGESVKSFDVPITDDRVFEGDETVIVHLCRPTGGAVLGVVSNATILIANDDSAAPFIISQPRSAAVGVGSRVTLGVTVSGQGPFYYQWRKNGGSIGGANGATYVIASAGAGAAGNYSVFVTNAFGEALSRDAAVSVYPAPVIHEQPGNLTVTRGTEAVLRVVASGFNTTTQIFNRAAVGGMEDRFAINTGGRAGRVMIDYDFFSIPDSMAVYFEGSRVFDTGMTNGSGSVRVFYSRSYYSAAVEIVVNEGLTNQQGTAWNYQARVVPESLQYQWTKDGAIIPGATAAALVIPYATETSAGQYAVTVSDGFRFVVSQPATLTVILPTRPTIHFVRLVDGRIQLSWEDLNFVLESATDVGGPWEYIAFGVNSVVITPGEGNQFFRLRENYATGGD